MCCSLYDGLLWSPNKKDADPLSWDNFHKLENDNPVINAKKSELFLLGYLTIVLFLRLNYI